MVTRADVKQTMLDGVITPDEAALALNRLDRQDREVDILNWGKHYFPDKFYKPFCEELHRYFIDIRGDEMTATLAPRNHAKTMIKCFLIPLYQALVEPKKYRHYLNIQNTTTKAISINLMIRQEVETNERLRRDYSDQFCDNKWTEKQFVLKNGTAFTAIGTGESVRGLNYQGVRPDYIVLDDIYDEEDIHNNERIKKIEDWFWGAIYPARDQHKQSSIHVQGTAINKEDLMRKLAKVEGVKYRKFQAITDYKKRLSLWFGYEQLMVDRKRMGSIKFEREMQNECRDDESAILKESWIRFYDGRIPEGEKVVKIIGGIDPASGEKQLNDYTGMACVYQTDLHNYYIDEVKNERLSFDKRLKAVETLHSRHRFHRVNVEAIAAFKDFANELKRTTSVPVREISFVKDKITRLENQSHKFENGKVFINSRIPEGLRNELVEQLINNFPNHDDIRDAVILCLEDEPRAMVMFV